VICRVSLLAVFASVLALKSGLAQTDVIARLPETTRAEVVARAESLAKHPWVASASNLHASCSKSYVSDWKSGQRVTGLPYCWGGVDSAEQFDRKLAKGLAAGAHSRYGVLGCATGIDCSGFVTMAWGLTLQGHAYTTSNLRTIAGKPKYNWFTDMKPGDVLNKAGSHVVLFIGYNADGSINVCEASGSAARVICHRTTWSRYKGYIPLVYKGIED
jgi:cell wall-associated NlpC family hydrolase